MDGLAAGVTWPLAPCNCTVSLRDYSFLERYFLEDSLRYDSFCYSAAALLELDDNVRLKSCFVRLVSTVFQPPSSSSFKVGLCGSGSGIGRDNDCCNDMGIGRSFGLGGCVSCLGSPVGGRYLNDSSR
jgi:hypothetical protein